MQNLLSAPYLAQVFCLFVCLIFFIIALCHHTLVQSQVTQTNPNHIKNHEMVSLFILFHLSTTCPCPKNDRFSAGLQIEFINPIFEFSKGMNELHLDEAEYALLIAINIFSAGQSIAHVQVICTADYRPVMACIWYFLCVFWNPILIASLWVSYTDTTPN